MALTDRSILKEREVGVAQSYPLAGSAADAVAAKHTRIVVCPKITTENAETSMTAEVALMGVTRACKIKAVQIVNNTTLTENSTDCIYVVVGKSVAGAASVAAATWNTGIAAQGGTITKWVPAAMIVSPNADATLAVGDVLTLNKTATSTGGLLDGHIVVDLEEI